jgi:hypothetical protein
VSKITAGGGGAGGAHPAGADGMTVPGQRHPYGDKLLILAAPGEEVISNRFGQADQFRADRAAGRIPAYAGGGSVSAGFGSGGRSASAIAGSFGVDIDHDDKIKRRLNLFGKALDRATDSLSNEKQARDSLMGSITSNLTGSLFSSEGGGSAFSGKFAAGSVGAANATLQQQIRDARDTTSLEKQLRARGVSGAALQDLIQNGGVSALRQFAAASNADLQSYQSLYGQRTAAVATAASTGADVLGMTSAVNKTTSEVRVLTAEVRGLKKQIAAQHKAAQEARKKHAAATGHAVVKANDKSAKNARHR